MRDYTRQPISKTSALVMSKGVKFEHDPVINQRHWETCPPLRKADKSFKNDLTGTVIGRFKVVGMHKFLKSRWVVRCSCGDYETRSAKAIRNQNNFGDRCANCRNIAYIKKSYAFRTQGIGLDVRALGRNNAN